jgi:hypothetical protein
MSPNLDIYTCHINNNRDRCHMYNILVLKKKTDNLWHSEINVNHTPVCWSVCTNPGKWAVMCLKDIDFVSTIFLLDFGPVPTMFAGCFILQQRCGWTRIMDPKHSSLNELKQPCKSFPRVSRTLAFLLDFGPVPTMFAGCFIFHFISAILT